MKISLRPGTPDDLPFLREMLFEAAYWRPEVERPSIEDGLARPDIAYLLEDWGSVGDTALIAIANGVQSVGAAWYRFWTSEKHSYGFVAPTIPELAIAVHAEFRGMGIGNKLLAAILDSAAAQGIEKISLSVEIENPALKLYQKHGFQSIHQNPGDWIMVANTQR